MFNYNYDLIGKRKYFFAFSIILTLIGLVAFFVNGVTLDLQFQGGTMIEIQVDGDELDIRRAEGIVTEITGKQAVAQRLETLSGDETITLLMLTISSAQTLTGDEINAVVDALKKEFDIPEGAQMNVQTVQPLIGREMLGNGIKAIIWACVLMVIFIWYRFRTMANSGLAAALTAVAGLIHDSMIMFSVYLVFRLPLNEAFIAAVLTVLGYSINDTIIIYDRIRENSTLMRKVPVAEYVNRSIMQTMTRSINTVLTVLICILVIFIYGSANNIASLTDFSFPLLIGITSGAYSSIFICSPLWVLWKESRAKAKPSGKVKPSGKPAVRTR